MKPGKTKTMPGVSLITTVVELQSLVVRTPWGSGVLSAHLAAQYTAVTIVGKS